MRQPEKWISNAAGLPSSSALTFQAIILSPVTRLVFDRPGPRALQWILLFLALEPFFQPGFVHRKMSHLGTTRQFSECLHHLRERWKNDFIHRFGFTLAGVSVEISPTTVRAKHKHMCLGYFSLRVDPGLHYKVGTISTPGAEV